MDKVFEASEIGQVIDQNEGAWLIEFPPRIVGTLQYAPYRIILRKPAVKQL
jgi:hypothetical protein